MTQEKTPRQKKLKQTVMDLITEKEKKTRDNLWISRMQLFIIPESLRPNVVTAFRFVLVGLSIVLYFQNPHITYLQWLIIIVAAWTDWVDGSMARTRNQITATGTFMDPIADNCLVFWIFWMLIKERVLDADLGWFIIGAQVVIMVCAGILVLREYLSLRKTDKNTPAAELLEEAVYEQVAVSFIGRLHFLTLVISIVFLMFSATVDNTYLADVLGKISLPLLAGGFGLFFLTERVGYQNIGKLAVVFGLIFLTLWQLVDFSYTIGTIFLWISIAILVFELLGYIVNRNLLPKNLKKPIS
jgi:phosphatidylglycerophosphate synthase